MSYTKVFLKDVKPIAKRGKDRAKLQTMIISSQKYGKVGANCKTYKLKGGYYGCWECYI
ncbi:MAG: hypothetical protein ACKKL4_02695 [Patescibacteria group bacterium]